MKKKICKIILYVLVCIIAINGKALAIEDSNIELYSENNKEIKTENKSAGNNSEISDGFYQIISENNKVLDVLGAYKNDNALVGLWDNQNNANQRYKIQAQSDGNYKIIAVHSGLVLEASGSNIKQNNSSNSNSQKWSFEEVGDKYYIKSVSTGLYLTENGDTNLILFKLDDIKNQKFNLNKQASLSGTKTIEEGYYVIKTCLDTNKVLDINEVSKENEANIQLWSKNQGSNQIFELIYDNKTGTYKIKSAFSGKVFDLPWAGKNNGTNVQLYDDGDNDWQKWVIEKTNNNYYTISSICNGLYLDVTGNKTSEGTNIEVYQGNNGKNQKFIFEKIEIPKGVSDINNGFYQISATFNENKVFDILGAKTTEKALVGMWENNSNANQRFKIIQKTNGYYSIINLNSELYLEADGLDIKQCKQDNNTIAQDWILIDCKDGNYNIVSRCGALYVTFDGNSNLKLSKLTANNLQKFKLKKEANTEGKQTIPDGYYIIQSAINTNKAIDIESASINSEANVILWDKSSRNNQKFKFTYDGNGYYTITSVKSNKVLDVAWASKNKESNIQQYTNTGKDWQKWIVEKNSDGSYCIISAYNGLYIDLPYSSTKNGNNIQLYNGNGAKNQKFILEETFAVDGSKTIADGYYKIETNLGNNQVIDIENASKTSHTKASIWSNNNGYNQRFKISYRENGFYTITAAHSGKALDITSDGKAVEQDNLTYDEEQEWVIKKASNGLYYIISAHNGLYLNVDGLGEKGSNINFSKTSNSKNQLFKFSSTSVETGGKTIADGTYQIITNLDNNKVLDIEGNSNSSGANVEIWYNNKQNNQKFNIKYQGNGYYKIFAVNSGKALGVEEAGTGNLVNVRQYDVSDSINQDWFIKSCGNGYYNIISACNGLYLDVFDGNTSDGTNVEVYTKNNGAGQKFKFQTPFHLEVTTGTYGSSGLKIKGDNRGQNLKYYKIGNGPNVFFATFAIHGWEDLYDYDGQALTKIAEDFKNKLIEMQDKSLADKWTIYIFPSLNPDGEYHGNSHNGPGRTTLYSAAPNHKGIDMNRCWSTGYSKETRDRNYNGTEPFQAYEARALRDFLLNKKATNGQTILVDLHGWLNETMGDNGIGSYYRPKYGISKHIDTYGRGYLINWARSNLGCNGRAARSCLVELPEWNRDSWRYIDATIDMLRNIV